MSSLRSLLEYIGYFILFYLFWPTSRVLICLHHGIQLWIILLLYILVHFVSSGLVWLKFVNCLDYQQ
ncbi:hypothetical protein J3Q64DRAFT_1725834 [Phycomyces blakesleeanus]|uniref:Uncharacterized protein n=1 Tax=Phycomyces blakesleeanus TaxID=4837 RepID=A0ABR3BAV7_PHYBL